MFHRPLRITLLTFCLLIFLLFSHSFVVHNKVHKNLIKLLEKRVEDTGVRESVKSVSSFEFPSQ